MTVKSKHGFRIEGLYQSYCHIPSCPYFNDFKCCTNRAKWRRANNATGTSNGHSNQHTVNSNSGGCDNASSTSSDDEDLSQKPLQMYLHHQQYYKQMKELQKQQQLKDTASDNDDNVEVN